MPNRILKESICASPNINQLSDKAEAFFYRLIVNCDDYGRLDGRPIILILRCYPLRIKDISEDDIVALLSELSSAKLITIYKKDDRHFIQITTWEKHQQIRAKKSKYPTYDSTCQLLLSDDFRNQMIANDSICPRNPIQSNPIVIRNPININSNDKNNGSKKTKDLVNTEVLTNNKEITYVKIDENGNPIKEKAPKPPKDNKRYGVEIGQIFKYLDTTRGEKIPKRNAEAASIIRLLKRGYTVEQIINTWKQMKTNDFRFKDRELFMMSVESDINAKIKSPIASATQSNSDRMEGMQNG